MFHIQTLNKIAPCGMNQFDSAKYTWGDDVQNPDAIILRSFNMHDLELPGTVKAVARAGAGVNNIPVEKYAKQGIVV